MVPPSHAAPTLELVPRPTPHDEPFARARLLVERAVRRRWQEGLLTRDPDGVFTGVLGADDVERLFRAPLVAPTTGEPLIDARFDPASPLGALGARLALRPTELDLLALLLVADGDPVCTRLLAYLGGNQSPFQLTVDLALEVVYRARGASAQAAGLAHRDLADTSRLRRLGLVLVDGADSRPTLGQSLRLPARVIGYLHGEPPANDGRLALVPPHAAAMPCDERLVAQATAALAGGGRLLLVDGPPASGRQLVLEHVAQRLGLPLVIASLNGRDAAATQVVDAVREAALHGAVLVLRDPDALLDGAALAALGDGLGVLPQSVAVIGSGRLGPALSRLRPTSTLEVSVPAFAERDRLWRGALGTRCALTVDERREIASLYHLGAAGIHAAAAAARDLARLDATPLGREHVARAVRQLFDADLAAVATRVEVTQTWADLVVPDDVGDSIVDFIERVRRRNDVLGDWGFAKKLGKGLGVCGLFAGEPGTGKSMAAGLVARELGLDLYVVDLSRITSKWIGETEKNLARAFDAAEAGHVLLLFDEADSVLGRRTDVKSSNDRHANMETNFLLARLEQFRGVALFTTNLASAIDPAIARRMAVQLQFSFPDAAARAELWKRTIPKEAPLARDVDFAKLGKKYELAGGFIRNIVLRAAHAAAAEGAAIAMRHLERAAAQEYRERGSLTVGGRLA